MKNIPPALLAHLQQSGTTLAIFWKLKSVDGTVRGFTSNTRKHTIDGVTYSGLFGMTPSSVTTNITFAVSNMEVEGILVLGGFDRDDVLHGKWNKAEAEVFVANWADTSQGIGKLRKGWVGEIQLGEHGFTGEIRGLTQALSQKIVELYSPACRADLGDARCMVRLDPAVWQAITPYALRKAFSAEIGSIVKPTVENDRHFTCGTAGTSDATEPTWNTTIGGATVDGTAVWTTIQALQVSGTITSLTNDRVFFDSSRTEADAYFDQGKLVWTSGNNIGRSMEVKLFLNSGGQIELTHPMLEAVQVNDAYIMHAGCSKDFDLSCKPKFDNPWNFQGEKDVPQTGASSILNT